MTAEPLAALPLSVVPILATPFGVVRLPTTEARNRELTELFLTRLASSGGNLAGSPKGSPYASPAASSVGVAVMNGGCRSSGDDLFDWSEPAVQELRADIFRGILAVIETVNSFPDERLRSFELEARGWVTVIGQDGCVPATNHPLTAWCAIYCVAAPAAVGTMPAAVAARQDSGMLRLYESRLGTMFQDASNSVMRMPYLSGHYGWQPVPGQLAVFPASLTHEIALLRAPGPLVLVTTRARFVAPGQQGMGRW